MAVKLEPYVYRGKNKNRRCQHIYKDGRQCRNVALMGGRCRQHLDDLGLGE